MNDRIDLTDVGQSGLYFVGEPELDTLDAAAHAVGHLVRRVSLAGCRDKTDLLRRVALTFEFPGTFGANWDALADSLGDLGWLPTVGGYVWLFDHAEDLRDAAPTEFDMLRTVLADACSRWRARRTPCFAFVALPECSRLHAGSRQELPT